MTADILTRAEVAAMESKPTTEWEARLAATCIAYMDAHERVEGVCDKETIVGDHMAINGTVILGRRYVSAWDRVRRANALRGEGETDAK